MQAAALAAGQPSIDTSSPTRPRVLSIVARELLRFALLHPTRTFTAATPLLDAMRHARKPRREALRVAAQRAAITLTACFLLMRVQAQGAARYRLTPSFQAATTAARLLLTRQEER